MATCKSTPESDIFFLDPSGLYVIKPLPPVGQNLCLSLSHFFKNENAICLLDSTCCTWGLPQGGSQWTCGFMPVYPLVVCFKFPSPSISVVQEVPEFLSSHWDTMCVMYVDNIKAVMQHLRTQRTEIDLRFNDMRYSCYALEILWT